MGKATSIREQGATPANDIKLKKFRMILQWPLVLDGSNSPDNAKSASSDNWVREEVGKLTQALDKDENWQIVDEALNYPPSIEPCENDGGGYAQFSYFHDFVQKFLFPVGDNPAFSLYERKDITEIETKLNCGTYKAKVDRLSLHVFNIGTAIMTLELDWDIDKLDTLPLTLADAQNLIDHFRRTYTPFWFGDSPQRVPIKTKLGGANDITPGPQPKAKAIKALENSGPNRHDIRVFDHWREMIKPLTLISDGGNWRDPSDERMPLNTYIALDCDDDKEREEIERIKKIDEKGRTKEERNRLGKLYGITANKSREALLAITNNDWIRLADAEERGEGCPYNPEYITDITTDKFYDRFYAGKNSRFTTRHIIDAAHYCMVGAGDFVENIAIHHFRRHYTLLSLIARFEFTALLAISSRLTNAVIRFENNQDEIAFENDIINIQGQFLNFMHRYRFSGVSSQLQAGEMFSRWRKELELDVMFEDVRAEVDVAFQRVMMLQQQREANAATELNKLALVGVVLGLIAGFMGANIFVGPDRGNPFSQFFSIVSIVFLALAGGAWVMKIKPETKAWRRENLLAVAGFGALMAAIFNYLDRGFVYNGIQFLIDRLG